MDFIVYNDSVPESIFSSTTIHQYLIQLIIFIQDSQMLGVVSFFLFSFIFNKLKEEKNRMDSFRFFYYRMKL